jgi:excisionase family DNA binding protein
MKQVHLISITPHELIEVFTEKMKTLLHEELQKNQIHSLPEKKYLTRAEACEFLGITYGGLHKWVREGRISAQKISNKPYFLRTDLEALLTPVKK